MKLYGVVIMDVHGSRNMPNRLQFQETLIKYIGRMNEKFNNILAAPISITLGDEWQAITHSPSECYEIVHEFQQYLWQAKVEVYAGIGIGELATEVYDDIRRMDGPCFHIARNAIEIAKNQAKLKNRLIYSKHNKVYFHAQSVSIPNVVESSFAPAWYEAVATKSTDDNNSFITFDELINTLIENNEILKARMTLKQKRIYIDYIKHRTYRKILEEYGDTTSETISGISQKLNSAEFFTIQRNQKIIKILLDTYCSLRGLA